MSLIDWCLLVILLFVLCLLLLQDDPKLPPGPMSLPIVGHVFFLTRKPHLRLGEWARIYGNVFLLKLANFRMVVISDPEVAREAYANDALLGRPDFPIVDVYSDGHFGLFGSQGPEWTQLRRFTLRQLRDLGFGKRRIQDMYLEEVDEFINSLKVCVGQSVCLNRRFSLAAINALWMVLTGTRFRHDDETLTNLLDSQTNVFQGMSKSPIAIFFPEIAKLLPKWTGWRQWENGIAKYKSEMAKPVDDHKLTDFGETTEPRDFTDAFLHKINRTSDRSSPFYRENGDKNLKNLIGELFGAGAETTAQTLSFAILYLAKYRNIQEKLQQELDEVVGPNRPVSLDDRRKMPYCQALILETLRKSTITPFGIFHATIRTTHLRGYKIPKGTWVCLNQHYIHHNEQLWSQPEEFQPERFISPDGGTVIGSDSLVAFSVGKRSCPGESLAKDGVFLFLANMFKNYYITFDPDFPEPITEGTTGLFRMCEKFNVILHDRVVTY